MKMAVLAEVYKIIKGEATIIMKNIYFPGKHSKY